MQAVHGAQDRFDNLAQIRTLAGHPRPGGEAGPGQLVVDLLLHGVGLLHQDPAAFRTVRAFAQPLGFVGDHRQRRA